MKKSEREEIMIERMEAHFEKLENALSHLEEIFEKALDLALEKKDPKRKLERRRKREAKKKNSCLGKPGAEKSESKKAEKQAKPTPSRYIPSEVRERVLESSRHVSRPTYREVISLARARSFSPLFPAYGRRFLRSTTD